MNSFKPLELTSTALDSKSSSPVRSPRRATKPETPNIRRPGEERASTSPRSGRLSQGSLFGASTTRPIYERQTLAKVPLAATAALAMRSFSSPRVGMKSATTETILRGSASNANKIPSPPPPTSIRYSSSRSASSPLFMGTPEPNVHLSELKISPRPTLSRGSCRGATASHQRKHFISAATTSNGGSPSRIKIDISAAINATAPDTDDTDGTAFTSHGGASASSSPSSPIGGSGGPNATYTPTILRTFDKASGKLVRVSASMFSNARTASHDQYMIDRADTVKLSDATRRVRALPFQAQFDLAKKRFYRGAVAKIRGRLAMSGGLYSDDITGETPEDEAAATAALFSSLLSRKEAEGKSGRSVSSSAGPRSLNGVSTKSKVSGVSEQLTLPSIPKGVDGEGVNKLDQLVHERALLQVHIELGDIVSYLGKDTESIGMAKITRAAVDQYLFEDCKNEAKRHLAILTKNLLPADLAPVELLQLQLDSFRHWAVRMPPRQLITTASLAPNFSFESK